MQATNIRNSVPAILPNPASAVRSDKAAHPQITPGTLPAGVPASDIAQTVTSDRLPPVFPAALTASDLDALQSVEHGKSAESPAHLARAFIADNPEFADGPFGHVVSQFARGETPVTTPSSEPAAEPPPADGEVPAADAGTPSDPVSEIPGDTGTDTAVGSDVPPSDTPPTDTTIGSDLPSDTPPTDTTLGSDLPPADTPETTVGSDLPPADSPETTVGSDLPPSDVPFDLAGINPEQDLLDALAG